MRNLGSKARWVFAIAVVILLALLTYLAPGKKNVAQDASASDPFLKTSLTNQLSGQRLRFVENRGQAGMDVLYHVQGAGHTVLFYRNQIVLRRAGVDAESQASKSNEVVLQFAGADENPVIEGIDQLPGVAHFYKGQDPDHWQTNVPTFGSVLYRNLYPGIDMAYIGDDGALESEFYVAPGADYRQIRLNYKNVQSRTIRDDGALVLETYLGSLVEKAPIVYQDIAGDRIEIDARFVLFTDESIGFELGEYDRNYAVVIDPELIFLVSFGAGIGITSARGVVIDNDGNVVSAGVSNLNFSTQNTIAASNDASISGLLMKLDGTTGDVLFSALFGGSGIDEFNDLTIDQEGNLYLTGYTESDDFPVLNPAQAARAGAADAFLVILTADMILTYSTYLGGTDFDEGRGISLDGSGNVFVGGTTASTDFPTTTGAFQETFQGIGPINPLSGDYFAVRFNGQGTIDYSTYLGGSDAEYVCRVVANPSGELTVTGVTESLDFPLVNAFQGVFGGGGMLFEGDITVSRLNSTGSGLIYSTYVGGARGDTCSDIALGPNDDVFVSGSTTSDDFPVIGGTSTPETGVADGILLMLDNTGQPVYSVRSNIPGEDTFGAVAAFENDAAFVVNQQSDFINIYEKKVSDPLAEFFTFDSPEGHRVNGAYMSEGVLAIAGTSFPGAGKVSGGGRSTGLGTSIALALLAAFEVEIVDGELIIRTPNGIKKIGVDDDGNVTIDGVSTGIKASTVQKLKIQAGERNDNIDVSGVTPEKFPAIPETGTPIEVDAGGGDDLVQGAIKLGNLLFGGEGDDTLTGGDKSDIVKGGPGDDKLSGGLGGDFLFGGIGIDWLYGGLGNDWLEFDAEDEMIEGGEGADIYLLQQYTNVGGKRTGLDGLENVVHLTDVAGTDTLSFSGHTEAISVDMALMNSPQTIDASGTQISLDGVFEVVIGSEFDDVISVSPLPAVERSVDGGAGTDLLNYRSVAEAVDDGSTITTTSFADVTYVNMEVVNLSIIVAIDETDPAIPSSFSLNQNYPNPFNPTTSIEYSLPEASDVSLKLYNAMGQQIAFLVNEHQVVGNYSVSFNAGSLPSGVYFYEMRANGFVSVKKMILLK